MPLSWLVWPDIFMQPLQRLSIPPFLVGAGLSLIACLIAVFATKKPPMEAYESFFEIEVK